MATLRFSCGLLLFGLISGCAWLPDKVNDDAPEPTTDTITAPETLEVTANEVMVRDLVSSLVQIMPPSTTTVQVSAMPPSSVYPLVVGAMAIKGYGIQKVSEDQGANFVTVDLDTTVSDKPTSSYRMRIGVGAMSISRSYDLVADEAIQPASPFRLYGTRASIDIAATLFGANGISVDSASATEYVAPIALDEPLPTLSLITPEVVQGVVNQTVGSPGLTSFNSSKVEINNLFYSDTTFSSILDDYEPVDELTVIFPNDSIVMGNENKLLIRQFVERFSTDDEVLSVVGCSNGPTASELGNAGLALGRAERVTTELVQLGVPRDKVLDEGCWAPQGGVKDFPGRGVVMERWRRVS